MKKKDLMVCFVKKSRDIVSQFARDLYTLKTVLHYTGSYMK